MAGVDPLCVDLGLPQPTTFAVPANTLIIANTHGFHARGASVRPSCRVEIWASGRRNPFLPWVGLDPWSIAALGDRRVPLYWRVRDLAEGIGLKGNVWQPRQNISAFDGAS
jgi:hypothetical protein